MQRRLARFGGRLTAGLARLGLEGAAGLVTVLLLVASLAVVAAITFPGPWQPAMFRAGHAVDRQRLAGEHRPVPRRPLRRQAGRGHGGAAPVVADKGGAPLTLQVVPVGLPVSPSR